jgi:hypothetical protein
MLKDLEHETLTPQERASAILYNNAAPQFSTQHDLSAYNEIVETKYANPNPIQSTSPIFERYAPPPVTESPKGAEFQSYYRPAETVEFTPKIVNPAIQTIQTPEPMEEIASAPVTDFVEEETADENTEYVVKFKMPTVITAACIAVILVLLAVLLIFNAVNIAKANVELRQLQSESETARNELTQAQQAAAEAKQKAIDEIEGNLSVGYKDLPQGKLPSGISSYEEPADLESSTNAFDMICKFFSKIFG